MPPLFPLFVPLESLSSQNEMLLGPETNFLNLNLELLNVQVQVHFSRNPIGKALTEVGV